MRIISPLLKRAFGLFPNVSVPIPFGRMQGTKWMIASANPGQVIGRYESQQETILANLLEKSEVFWDIGAHVGWYSLLANKLMRSSGRIVCFEPNPNNFTFIEKHIERNKSERIQAFNLALSNETGEALFSGANQTGGLTETQSSSSFSVTTITVDEFIERHQLVPDLIKMDVEGAEDKVLAGAESLLTLHRPTILLSTHGWQKREACQAILQSYGYTLESVVSNVREGDYVFLARWVKEPRQ